MPALTTHPLTDQQRAFVVAYTADDPDTASNGKASAIKAGYAAKHAAQESYRLLHNDAVRAEIDRLNRLALRDLATASIRLLGRVVKDERAPLKLRVASAKTILDRAGYIAPKASEPERQANDKPMAQWTAAELEEFLERTRAKLAHAQQEMIDVTPAPADGKPQPLEIGPSS